MKRHIWAYVRAIGVSLSLLALVVGTTMAALNTQATLEGSSLSTTSADLLIWDGQAFSDSAPGFVATNIVPGAGSPEFRLAFKNTGGNPLSIGLHVPTSYVFSGFNSTSATTAMKSVKVIIKDLSTGQETTTTLYALSLSTDVPMPGAPIGPGVEADMANQNSAGNYSIRFDVDAAAIGTTQARVEPFDITFTGRIAER